VCLDELQKVDCGTEVQLVRVGKWFLILGGAWLVLPAVLVPLYARIEGGLIWFFLHQLYYAPLGTWIREPFFTPAAEVGFWVHPWGRVLTAAFYAVALVGGRAVVLMLFGKRGR
jgi:hypothetical protein